MTKAHTILNIKMKDHKILGKAEIQTQTPSKSLVYMSQTRDLMLELIQ